MINAEQGPASSTVSFSGLMSTRITPAGYMGEFGSGKWRVFGVSSTFTVPAGVTKIRVRVVGGGAGGGGGAVLRGGSGGGYAHGVFNVTPGSAYTVTVGLGGAAGIGSNYGGSGGTSSFGALISATGGVNGSTPVAGVGTGGDFQASGGIGGYGGGAAGSQLGDGGQGNASGLGGCGVGGGDSAPGLYGGGSPFGYPISLGISGGNANAGAQNIIGECAGDYSQSYTSGGGIVTTYSQDAIINAIKAVIRFPFDGFVGGGGGGLMANAGGVGAGGGAANGVHTNYGGHGGVGAGGGAAVSGNATQGGDGGFGGGGGAGLSQGGKGGQGIVIVEW